MRNLKLTEEEFALINQALNLAAIFLKSKKNIKNFIDADSDLWWEHISQTGIVHPLNEEENVVQFCQDKACSFEDLIKKIYIN